MESESCIFCKIASGEIPGKPVYEDDFVYAFNDLAPQGPVHVLLVPKAHYANLLEVESENLLGHLFKVAASIAREKGLDESGFRIVVNTGKDGGQSVNHLHLHIIGGRELAWPPG